MRHKVRSQWDNCSGIEWPMAEPIEPANGFKFSGIGALNSDKSEYSGNDISGNCGGLVIFHFILFLLGYNFPAFLSIL